MTQDNYTEAGDESVNSSSEDSAVIKALRAEVKELQREVKGAPKRSELEAELRTQLAREFAIEGQLEALGLPKAVRELVDKQLSGEVTRESVLAAVTGIGFQVTPNAGSSQTEANSQAGDLAQVAGLSAQVAAAASNTPEPVARKIAQATTPEELAAVMAEQGLLSSQF